MTATRLFSRALLRLAPQAEDEDVADFLQGLVTNDVTGQLPVWAALLTPQGKALFEFLVWKDGSDLLIDCEEAVADALAKRLSLYRLRRKIAIAREGNLAVHWSQSEPDAATRRRIIDSGPWPCLWTADPRLLGLGWRWLAPVAPHDAPADAAWLAHRLSLGVTEGRAELGDGELLWLECNAAELNGVSFTKGCYVGQENTARMNWRQKVNRRLVVVPIGQSDPSRQRATYPELGLAVDHLRVEDIGEAVRPAWLQLD